MRDRKAPVVVRELEVRGRVAGVVAHRHCDAALRALHHALSHPNLGGSVSLLSDIQLVTT